MGEKTTRIDKARSNKNKKVSYRITITVQQLLIRLTDYGMNYLAVKPLAVQKTTRTEG